MRLRQIFSKALDSVQNFFNGDPRGAVLDYPLQKRVSDYHLKDRFLITAVGTDRFNLSLSHVLFAGSSTFSVGGPAVLHRPAVYAEASQGLILKNSSREEIISYLDEKFSDPAIPQHYRKKFENWKNRTQALHFNAAPAASF